MANKLWVRPKRGLKINDLDNGDFLPPEGREVIDSQFIQRRIRDGSLIVVDEDQRPDRAKTKPAAAAKAKS